MASTQSESVATMLGEGTRTDDGGFSLPNGKKIRVQTHGEKIALSLWKCPGKLFSFNKEICCLNIFVGLLGIQLLFALLCGVGKTKTILVGVEF